MELWLYIIHTYMELWHYIIIHGVVALHHHTWSCRTTSLYMELWLYIIHTYMELWHYIIIHTVDKRKLSIRRYIISIWDNQKFCHVNNSLHEQIISMGVVAPVQHLHTDIVSQLHMYWHSVTTPIEHYRVMWMNFRLLSYLEYVYNYFLIFFSFSVLVILYNKSM